jgi:hypothetical protein
MKDATKESGSLPSGDIVALGHALEKMGIKPSEHPAFGGVHPGAHGRNSAHNDGMAIDINAPGVGVEANDPVWSAKFDKLAQQIQAAGYTVLWKARNHYNHIHAQIGGKGIKGGHSYIGGSSGTEPTTEKHGSAEAIQQQSTPISAPTPTTGMTTPSTPSPSPEPTQTSSMSTPEATTPTSVPSAMPTETGVNPNAIMGMMGGMGNVGGMLGTAMPLLGGLLNALGSSQSMPQTFASSSTTAKTINQAAVESQATMEQNFAEGKSSDMSAMIGQASQNIGKQMFASYNNDQDLGWPSWAANIGGWNWGQESKKVKYNMNQIG